MTKTWSRGEILDLFALPFNDLLYQAHQTHRANWDANKLQLSALLSFKTGGCSEDCGYCAQSKGSEAEETIGREEVKVAARKAKEEGATRFCMSAAWRKLKEKDLLTVVELVEDVKSLGLETCMTLGMVTREQADRLKDAGLDYYNHNVDTSPEYYAKVITTHAHEDRLDTLEAVRAAGLKICSGGIVGMGEEREDRAGMLETLANLAPPPESVPINMLVPIPGTKMEDMPPFDPFELVRTIAAARICMPQSYVRLSAGRRHLSEETQALCFFAGANSVFHGERLLTTENRPQGEDGELFGKLGLSAE